MLAIPREGCAGVGKTNENGLSIASLERHGKRGTKILGRLLQRPKEVEWGGVWWNEITDECRYSVASPFLLPRPHTVVTPTRNGWILV